MKIVCRLWLVLGTTLTVAQALIAANDVPTGFTNQGGIVNTRHNMSQNTEAANNGETMDPFRNRYGEICVYCHTPHGANTDTAAPLWNRSLATFTIYQTYDQLNTSTLTQPVNQPGAASLVCLSCHDGSQAIDAIINMPGAGQYSATPDPTLWNPFAAGYPASFKSVQHRTLAACITCHNDASNGSGGFAIDFAVFNIGTDLRNDHPVGVAFPPANGPGTDWNRPTGRITIDLLVSKFFDDDPIDSHMDKTEIRLYGSGKGASVECASCHDPHGVPANGAGSLMIPTFMRKSNAGSAVCLTCHNK